MKIIEGATIPTNHINDLRAFRDFVDTRLSDDDESLTLDEALELWEHENQTESERHEANRAIRQGLDDVDAGRSQPFETFDWRLYQKHSFPPRSRPSA